MSESVVIIGASGGIGTAVAHELYNRGAKVFLFGRNQEKMQSLMAELDQPGMIGDATSFDQVESCFQEAKKALGDITGIVNCVGSVLLKPAHLTSEEEWTHTVTTNLHSAFATVKYGVPQLRNTKGSLVLVSTAAADIGLANHEAIAAAKGGINGLVLSASATYASKGVRINAVAPGLVQTDLTSDITGNEAARNFSLKMHPVGRLGEPSDISSAICWMLDPRQSWVTGQILAVDGGLSSLKVLT